MAIKDERVKTRLEDIQRMSKRYEEYLQRYGYGGDWDMHSFMNAINTKAREVENLLENTK